MNQVTAQSVKSNKSENMVWLVGATKKDRKYCRNCWTALRYAFILHRRDGRQINKESFDILIAEVRKNKTQSTAVEQSLTGNQEAE